MFLIEEQIKNAQKKNVMFARANGSVNQYEMVPGKQAYTDGMFMGIDQGYKNAIEDVKSYIVKRFNQDTSLNIQDVLSEIVLKKR